MMNSMLVSSHAPNNLWGEALLSACFLLNRIPHRTTGKTPYELWRGYQPNLKYLKVWGCLAKVMLPEPTKRKLGSKTSNCMFIGYAQNSVAYRFLVLKSDVLDCNTIMETKNAEFFESIFPLKSNSKGSSKQPLEINFEGPNEELRRSTRQRKGKSFGSDFYIYLVDNEPKNFHEAISSSDSKFLKEAIKTEIDSITKNKTWILVDLPPDQKLLVANGFLKENIILMGQSINAKLV